MSSRDVGSTAHRYPLMSARGIRRGGVVAAVAAVAMTVPTTAADAQPTPAKVQSASVQSASVQSAAVVTIAPQVTISPSTRLWGGILNQAKYEGRLNFWMNRQRSHVGIRRVGVRLCLDGFAERWAQHLKATNSFYHQDLGGVMNNCRQSQAGEILAKGNVTPYQMVQMWMASPDHRRLMMSRDYGRAGISARRNSAGTWIGCIDFGRP